MRSLFAYITILLAIGSSQGRVSLDPPLVDLGYAKYQGTLNPTTNNTEFIGIRYAAPPTGNLRWRKPQAPIHESRLLLANSQPNRCYQALPGTNPRSPIRDASASTLVKEHFVADDQAHLVLENTQVSPAPPIIPSMSEDCLFLNVYSPGLSTPRKKLPVVFWIHGGGYILGSASGTFNMTGPFDGGDLIKQAGGKVVVVIVQYRLGLFGFLSSSQLKQDGALNGGLLDQEFALRWVQSHISKFGGDPTRVTIWGQSAGAGSVLQHLIANGGNTRPPLFRGAISSSSFLPSQYPFNHRVPENYFNDVLDLTGCSAAANPIQCLRNANVASLASANMKICNDAFFGTFAFVPVVDGSFIRESPTRAIQKGKLNTDHVLAVVNTREGDIFVGSPLSSEVTIQQYISFLFPSFTRKEIHIAASLYNERGSTTEQAIQVMSEAIFVCPTYNLLNAINGRAFKAEFAVPPALHGYESQYYFPSIYGIPPPFDNQQFINTFSQSFLDFVLEQDPNVKHDPNSILPEWSRWKRSSPIEAIFNRSGDLPDITTRTTPDELRTRCNFWENIQFTFQ